MYDGVDLLATISVVEYRYYSYGGKYNLACVLGLPPRTPAQSPEPKATDSSAR